jgi:hypothetical protein
MDGDPDGRLDEPPVLWTRGNGCAELAALLSGPEPVRVQGDLEQECVRHRAELLVSRRLPHTDLTSVAVPVDFAREGVGSVVAAVAGGPHSPLAARVARRLGRTMGLHASMVCAHRDDEGRAEAVSLIETLYVEVPGLEYRLIEADGPAALVAQLPEDALLVLGAPGGNWFQRTMFGRGARLRQAAPAGAVIVRQAPPRVFQRMGEPVFVGPLREAVDILRIHREPVLAVVDSAKLVGIVRRDALEIADPGVPVSELMEEPVWIPADATVAEAVEIAGSFDGALPVVDDDGRVVGGFTAG